MALEAKEGGGGGGERKREKLIGIKKKHQKHQIEGLPKTAYETTLGVCSVEFSD